MNKIPDIHCKDPAIEKWASFRNNPHVYYRPTLGSFFGFVFFMGVVPFTFYCIFLNHKIKDDYKLGREHSPQIWEEWLTGQTVLQRLFFRNLPPRTYPDNSPPARYAHLFK